MAANQKTVLLGLLDEEIKGRTTSFYDNKIGGKPDWLCSTETSNCALCENLQALVCQIYSPLQDSDKHRVLFIFACTQKHCWNKQQSWAVIRQQAKDITNYTTTPSQTEANMGETAAFESPSLDDWGGGASEWDEPGGENGGGDSSRDVIAEALCGATSTTTVVTPGVGDDWGTGGDAEDWVPEQHQSNGFQEHKEGFEGCSKTKESKDPNDDEINIIDSVTSNHDDCSVAELDKNSEINKINNDILETKHTNETTADFEIHSNISDIDINSASILTVLNINATESDVKTEIINDKSNVSINSQILQSYYINVFDESDCQQDTSYIHEQRLIREYAKTNNIDFDIDAVDRKSSGEGYEKAGVKHGDKTFHHFMKRINRCPEQVLRYSYGGEPLPLRALSRDDVVSVCEACGAKRVFELQLLPALVPALRTNDNTEPVVEYGTVLVYTCAQSCDSGNREHVIVQPDPDLHLFKT